MKIKCKNDQKQTYLST